MRPLNVGFYGPVSEPSGYGAASRAYVHAFHRAGLNLSVVDLNFGRDAVPTDALLRSLSGRKIEPDVHLLHYVFPYVARLLSLYSDKLVFMTTWETDILPEGWSTILNDVREVWVPCAHNVATFQKCLSVPVFKLPHAVEPQFETVLPSTSSVAEVRASDFVFYSIFVWSSRKYPEGIIEAFLRAFPSNLDVILVLKVLVQGRDQPLKALRELRQLTGSAARVLIIMDMWSEHQVQSLAYRGNCYVSLHRSEAWCYPLFDAACRGKPVIATAFSGPLEYLDGKYHSLVRYKTTVVDRHDVFFYPPMKWAEPDLLHASELMRRVYDNREEMAQRAGKAAEQIRRKYSLDTIGKLAKDRLEQIS